MSALQTEALSAQSVKFAAITREKGRESSTGRTVETFTAVDIETGEVIATKQVKNWGSITPSQSVPAEGVVREAARAAGYTITNEKGEM
ncbi:hypothetical protein [Sporosarcina obsidiansis]|uniref:hypothetical protein n=1 Tax=Sporosarcina obsidiansis TaxID=2660748 RepID=UPI00129AA409|nr:hypothetical protein [Sporosarcina obsidiansis]